MKQLRFRYGILSFISHMIFILIVAAVGKQPMPLEVSDSVTYKMDARNLLQHRVFSRENAAPYLWEPYRTPGYPLLIALSEKITGGDHLVLLFAAMTAGVATWVAVQVATMLGAGRPGQHVSGWMMALLPNSLGLATFLLTDAIFGYLFLLWIYLLYTGFYYSRNLLLIISAVILVALQFTKPTANLGILFIVGGAIFFARGQRQWLQAGLLVMCAVILPLSFATMNFRDNGIFSPSLLDIQTLREYLQVRYLAEQSGESVTEITKQVRFEDKVFAQQLSEPMSFYGRLYKVEQAAVLLFLQQHPIPTVKLMTSEMIKQFFAPQEFVILAFRNEVPPWVRASGSLFSILLWAGAFLGARNLANKGMFQFALLLLGTLAFFLVTGSVSHFVGARLRFPADLLAVPFFSYGISTLFPIRLIRVSA